MDQQGRLIAQPEDIGDHLPETDNARYFQDLQ